MAETQAADQAVTTAPTVDRKAQRASAIELADVVLTAGDDGKSGATLEDAIGAVAAMRLAFGPRTRESAGPRQILEKADPAEVAAYFTSTGLTRKQLAGAAGVSTSVIATVQNEKGDRWSAKTFAAKRELIDAYVEAHKDEIAAARAADEAAEQAKQAKIASKLAKAQAAATAKTQAKAAPAAKAQAPAPAARKGGKGKANLTVVGAQA